MKTNPLLFLTLILLSSCAYLGIPQAETFNAKLATGYITVTSVRETTTSLVSADAISPQDAANIQRTADAVRSGLDIAKTLGAGAGDDKLASSLILLTELQKYVNSKKDN